jgi:hypothetical protein
VRAEQVRDRDALGRFAAGRVEPHVERVDVADLLERGVDVAAEMPHQPPQLSMTSKMSRWRTSGPCSRRCPVAALRYGDRARHLGGRLDAAAEAVARQLVIASRRRSLGRGRCVRVGLLVDRVVRVLVRHAVALRIHARNGWSADPAVLEQPVQVLRGELHVGADVADDDDAAPARPRPSWRRRAGSTICSVASSAIRSPRPAARRPSGP